MAVEVPATLTNGDALAVLDVVDAGMRRARQIAEDFPDNDEAPLITHVEIVEAASLGVRPILIGKPKGDVVEPSILALMVRLVEQAEGVAGILDGLEPALSAGKEIVAAAKTAVKTGLALPLALFGPLGWVLGGAGVVLVIVGGVLIYRAVKK